jgi:hypothetical protein
LSLLQTFKMEKEFEAHSRKVNDVVAGKDYVYTSSDDRAVSAWQTDTTTRVCKVRVPPHAISLPSLRELTTAGRPGQTTHRARVRPGVVGPAPMVSVVGQGANDRPAFSRVHMSEHTELTHARTVPQSIAVWESDLELGARLCGYHTDAVSR